MVKLAKAIFELPASKFINNTFFVSDLSWRGYKFIRIYHNIVVEHICWAS